MSGEYITTGLVTDPEELLTGMIADYQTRVPGWAASPSDPLYVNLAIQAYRHAILLDVASRVLDAVFRYQGRSLVGLPPRDATRAVGDATFTVRESASPQVIPAGLPLDVYGPDPIRFLVLEDVLVPAGNTTTVEGEARIVAEDRGAEGSGLSGPVEIVAPLDYITGVELDGMTTAGRAGETDPEYLDRLSRRYRRFSAKVITPEDLAEAALDIPGVGRALVLDNYVPAGPGGDPPAVTDEPGVATLIIASPSGADVPSEVKTAVLQEVAASRLDDVLIHVIDPTRTTVGVTYTATSDPDWDPGSVRVAADAAVATYLSPATFALRGTSGQFRWRETLLVRYGELYAVLNAVEGLDTVDSLQITGVDPDTDFPLAGPGALPTVGAIAGTVNAPA